MSVAEGIGGYFDLAPGRGGTQWPWLGRATKFQSARAAIAAVFLANSATAAWVPWFVCGAVRDGLKFAGIPVRGYALSPSRGVPDDLRLGAGEWLLCVDYFGNSAAACDDAIARHGADRVLVDASQAFLHAPRDGVATVYSPRKFCGVPDGGLLVNAPYVAAPADADEFGSMRRSRALLLRASGKLAEGYAAFQEGEASLEDCTPQAMSMLTADHLAEVDVARMRTQRIANHTALADALRHRHRIEALAPDAAPLCCPVPTGDAPRLRAALAQRGIFCPAYWPDADVPADDATGLALRHGTLYLPCDQRYGPDDMAVVAHTLLELEESA